MSGEGGPLGSSGQEFFGMIRDGAFLKGPELPLPAVIGCRVVLLD
jgi:hypothetical protein